MNSTLRLKRNVAIAVVAGAIAGAAAGFASQPRHSLPAQDAPAAVVIVEPITAPDQAVSVQPVPARAAPDAAPPAPAGPGAASQKSPPPAAQATRPAGDAGSSAARARELAQRGDVSSLLVLRDEIVQRIQKTGESESTAIQRELDEVDRCIAEARARRLKIDGEAIQKSTQP
jgi:hypothetical protein